MFKIHIGVCICHNKQRAIVVKAGYCKEGNDKLKGKVINPLKRTKISLNKKAKKPIKIGKRKTTSELALFKEIWNERPHKSEVDGTPIQVFNIWCFSHILPKGLYPRYRLKKENIIIKTPDQHYDWGNMRYKLKEKEE